MKKTQIFGAMRDEVLSLPAMIRALMPDMESRTRQLLTTPEILSIREAVLTGCGDSYIAGRSATMAFNQFTGISCYALNAMQVARYSAWYRLDDPPNNPLVVSVSNSGEVARVVEAARACTQRGSLSVALTANPNSRLAGEVKKTLDLTIPSYAPAFGVQSYVACLLALYLIALRMGEVRGKITMDEATVLRSELVATASGIEKSIARLDSHCKELASEWSVFENFEILGSGPNGGTAAYGAAKLLEAAGVHAFPQDIEEWAHLQYFVSDARHTATIVVVPSNANVFSRAVEVIGFMKTLERPVLVLTDSEDDTLRPNVTCCWHVSSGVQEAFSPIVFAVPLALFAGYLAEELGASHCRGSKGQWSDSLNGDSVRKSALEILKIEGVDTDNHGQDL